ncbi:DnaJ family domain-containing protein [Nocardioides pakistanensis]
MRDRRRDRARSMEQEIEEERRLRRAKVTALTGQVPEADEATADSAAEDDEDEAPVHRMEQQALWVDLQVRRAMERGDFDDLPGAGKPIKGLGGTHDPDWWVKGLIEREQITGVLPPALALRKEDVELEGVLDRETTEEGVRRVVADFNRRIVEARRQLTGGPPVITPTRDEDAEVVAWRARRAERRERQRRQLESAAGQSAVPKPRPRPGQRWWRRKH